MGERVECPSGLVGELRGLTGKEVKLLTDKGLIKTGMITDAMLDACWISTIDPGPYHGVSVGNGKVDWQQVLQGDRFFLATRVHALTYGNLEFGARCPDEDCVNHKRGFMVSLDVTKDLGVKTLAKEDRAAFEAGNLLQAQLPDGRGFSFRLRTGADETRFAKKGLRESDAGKLFIPVMCDRIVAIDGVEDAHRRRFFEDSPLPVSFAALEAMDEHDCGVETKWENECPECGMPMEFEIPFRKSLLVAPKKAKLSSSSVDDLTS